MIRIDGAPETGREHKRFLKDLKTRWDAERDDLIREMHSPDGWADIEELQAIDRRYVKEMDDWEPEILRSISRAALDRARNG